MAIATERIPVQVTAQQKHRIEMLAESAGLTTSEYLRRAAEVYSPTEDDAMFEHMIEQMAKTIEHASAAIDDALRCVEESNLRIAAMEARTQNRKVA